MWIEHDEELFNLEKASNIFLLGFTEICICYGDNIDKEERVYTLVFKSNKKRNDYFKELSIKLATHLKASSGH